jgi:hypothetical protein
MTAWAKVEVGESNPLADLLSSDDEIKRYLSSDEIRLLLEASGHVGDAPRRTRAFLAELWQALK